MYRTSSEVTRILRQVREFVRAPFTSVGGYPLALYMTDGECLCRDCARAEYKQISNSTRHKLRDGWGAFGVDVYWEGPAMYCANCNAEIESAYGDPDPQ